MFKLHIVNSNEFVEVSQEDYEYLLDKRIYYTRGKYTCVVINKKLYRLNRVILERKLDRKIKKGYHCDHIDRNVYNNVRENLREVTPKENRLNQKSVKGELNPMFGKSGKLHSRSRPVFCVTKNKYFESGNMAALNYGLRRSDIYAVCSGRQKTVKGLVFKYS